MSNPSLKPVDYEAISQLRDLLRGDHGLTVEQEEQIIATYLEGRSQVPAVRNAMLGAAVRSEDSGWEFALLGPSLIEAALVGVAAITGLELVWSGGWQAVQGVYGASLTSAVLIGALGLLLLAYLPLRVLFNRRGSRGTEATTTAVSSVAGAGLAEYAALHWPSNSLPIAQGNFAHGNVLVLVLAVLTAILSYYIGLRSKPSLADNARRHITAPGRPLLTRRHLD
jgi:hypothetical protein